MNKKGKYNTVSENTKNNGGNSPHRRNMTPN